MRKSSARRPAAGSVNAHIAQFAAAAALLLLSDAVAAQAGLEPVRVGAAKCSAAVLGAHIDPGAIGEPTGGVQIDRITWHVAGERSPAACVIEGQILPLDTAATARPIRFAVGLPGTWNRRSIHEGGAGINGVVPRYSPARQRGGAGRTRGKWQQDFVRYGSDSGHDTEDVQWALNDEAIRNFGHAQLKKTHDVAQILIRRIYGETPQFRYFVGNSQGGREGLAAIQRHPADYDGVVATVPVVGLNVLMQEWAALRRRELLLVNHVPVAKGRAIAAEFMRQCDDLDGLDDGLINNYVGCRAIFNVNDDRGPAEPWAARRCPDGHDPAPADASELACLTDGQIDTLHYIFSSQPHASPRAFGVRSFGMWAPTTEVVGGGMVGGNSLLDDTRYRGQQGAPADAPVFAAMGSIGITGFLLGDLAANPLTFNMTAQLEQRQQLLSDWFDANNPDLEAFRRRGGKLIAAIGTNDTLASSGAQLDYYGALLQRMGRSQLDGFARLYVLPQRGHGLQGSTYPVAGSGKSVAAAALPGQFDWLAALQGWVERGEAPPRSAVLRGAEGATGLMCSYPEYPHHVGGEPLQAGSWRCQPPADRPPPAAFAPGR